MDCAAGKHGLIYSGWEQIGMDDERDVGQKW